uniref:Serine/threonine-protein kinase n=1 Tax=Syphacia muris TaxID=451379 RepID=A0A0N5B0E5_9BILA
MNTKSADDNKPWYIWLRSHEINSDDLEVPFYSQNRIAQFKTSGKNIISRNSAQTPDNTQKTSKEGSNTEKILKTVNESNVNEAVKSPFSDDRSINTNLAHKTSQTDDDKLSTPLLFSEYLQLQRSNSKAAITAETKTKSSAESKNESEGDIVKSPFDEIPVRSRTINEIKDSIKTPFDNIRTRDSNDNDDDNQMLKKLQNLQRFNQYSNAGTLNGRGYNPAVTASEEYLRQGSLNPAFYNVYPSLRRKDETYCADMQRMFAYTCFPGKRLRMDLLEFCNEYSIFCKVPNRQSQSRYPSPNSARNYQSGNIGVSSGFGLGLGILPGFGVNTGWGVNVGPIPGLPGNVGVNMPLNVGVLGADPTNQVISSLFIKTSSIYLKLEDFLRTIGEYTNDPRLDALTRSGTE